MIEIGYALSSEEHGPQELVRDAARAEEAGFSFALISDHFHPWIDQQGQSPFVWAVIGGIAQRTERLRLGTGVTCPLIRIHPAIIAQAAATAGAMMNGRFFLGVGTGENLNEHILGDHWPPPAVRLEMLEEAIGIMRLLWGGGVKSHRGRHYTVERARIYTLPDEPVPIMIGAKGNRAAKIAGRLGDGLISTVPEPEVVGEFERSGGAGKPRFGMLHVCWAEDEAMARKTALTWWPNSALKGDLPVELPLPKHFEEAAAPLDETDVASSLVCGPDLERHVAAITEFAEAGFDHVYVHQVGPDQKGFLRFYAKEVLPKF